MRTKSPIRTQLQIEQVANTLRANIEARLTCGFKYDVKMEWIDCLPVIRVSKKDGEDFAHMMYVDTILECEKEVEHIAHDWDLSGNKGHVRVVDGKLEYIYVINYSEKEDEY